MNDDDREIRFLGDVQRLSLEPGDTLVFRTDQHLSDDQVAWMKEICHVMGTKVLVVEGGLQLGVLRSEPESHLQRIESKLDRLLAALAEEAGDQPGLDLDGQPCAPARDETQSL